METLNTEEIYAGYVKDVVARHDAISTYQSERKDYWQNKSLDEIRTALKILFATEKIYRKPQSTNATNDFTQFEKYVMGMIILENFGKENLVIDITKNMEREMQKIDALPEEQQKLKMQIAEQKMFLELKKLYPQFKNIIEEQNLVKKYYQKNLIMRETENFARATIKKEFNEKEFDGTRDKGSCTKGIIASLYKIQEQKGLQLFKPGIDLESIIHPIDLTEQMTAYVKRKESGLVKDIENIKVGDIIMLTKRDGQPSHAGQPGHALMCYAMDENNEPLLLGFSPTRKGTKAYYEKNGDARQGFVIDIKSLICDKVKEKENDNQKIALGIEDNLKIDR